MNMLLTEILACLAAAALLSLIVGWAIKSVFASNKLKKLDAKWQRKHSELEQRFKQETNQLEDQIQTLGEKSKSLNAENRQINEALRTNEITVHKARADAIELNKQQADTQERLQRIIQQKDAELKRVRTMLDESNKRRSPITTATVAASTAAASTAAATTVAASATPLDNASSTPSAQVQNLNAKQSAWEQQRQDIADSMPDDMQTVAIDPLDIPQDAHDQTVRMDAAAVQQLNQATQKHEQNNMDDQTQILEEYEPQAKDDDFADSTVVLGQDQGGFASPDDADKTQRFTEKHSQAKKIPPTKL